MVFLAQTVQSAASMARTGFRRVRRQSLIGYIGWIGRRNLGDEAMLEAARRLFPKRRLEVFSGGRREAALERLGLSGRPVFEHVLLGGGTLVNAGYLGIAQRACAQGLAVTAMGTGVGSAGFGDNFEIPDRAWKQVLGGRIGLRGYRSLRKLEAIGIDRAEVIGDLALALAEARPAAIDRAAAFILNVAVPGARAPSFPVETLFQSMAVACRRLETFGLAALPIAFSPEDIAPIQAVLSQAGIATGEIARPSTAADYFALARRARLAVGVRLHCAVLSACVGLPTLLVAYREKAFDFAETIGMEDWVAGPSDLSNFGLPARAMALAQSAPGVGRDIHAKALHWRQRLEDFAFEFQSHSAYGFSAATAS